MNAIKQIDGRLINLIINNNHKTLKQTTSIALIKYQTLFTNHYLGLQGPLDYKRPISNSIYNYEYREINRG